MTEKVTHCQFTMISINLYFKLTLDLYVSYTGYRLKSLLDLKCSVIESNTRLYLCTGNLQVITIFSKMDNKIDLY